MSIYRKRFAINLCTLYLIFISSTGLAKYDPEASRGNYIQHFFTPYKNIIESCVIPKHSPLAQHKSQDRQDEALLCGLDFYNMTSTYDISITQAAICPKNHSTNPAVEIYRLKSKSLSIQAYEAQQCRLPSKKRDKKVAKRLAKFKQSISCSYTPSILAYYHVSRMLGNIVAVSPAVIRTMALQQHRKIAKLGYKVARKYKQKIQAQTWKNFIEVENHIDSKSNRLGKKYSNQIFTLDNKQIFGAIQKDVKHEEKYKEFYIKNVKNSYRRLTSQPFVKKLMRKNLNANASIAAIFQLKDYADMLLIDYLLSQEDRFGNMAYKDYHYFVNETGQIARTRIKDRETPLDQEVKNPNGYKVRRLVLKDNDCGVNRMNRTQKSKIMSKIRHISLNSYQYLLKLEANIETENLEHFFKNELLFTVKDWENFEQAVQNLSRVLQKNCHSGRLLLDLNPHRKMLGLERIDSRTYCDLSI